MKTVNVATKNALIQAKDAGTEEIIVTGDLANKLHKTKKIATAGPIALGLIGAAVAAVSAMPVSGGMSALLAFPAVTTAVTVTGTEIATIIIAASLGLALIIAVFRDYEEISFMDGKLVLRKRSKK